MRPAKPLSAKVRAVNMPGVDVGERANYAAPIAEMCGPKLRRLVCVMADGKETHLVSADDRPVCGAKSRFIDRHGVKTKACAACRIEASRLRATVTG